MTDITLLRKLIDRLEAVIETGEDTRSPRQIAADDVRITMYLREYLDSVTKPAVTYGTNHRSLPYVNLPTTPIAGTPMTGRIQPLD